MVNNNNRSLKHRIDKMISVVNFSSLLLMLIAFMIALGIIFKISSGIIVEYAAYQMKYKIERELNIAKAKGIYLDNSNSRDIYFKNLFKRVGFSFEFFGDKKHDFSINENSEFKLIEKELPTLSIHYKISKNGELIYDSGISNKKDNFKYKTVDENRFIKNINTTVKTIIYNEDESELVTLEVKLNSSIIYGGYIGLLTICIFLFILTLLITKLVFFRLSGAIIKPLSDLDKKMQDLANGNIEAAIKTEIKFDKPVYEVESLANSTNKIMSRMNEYIERLGNQNKELEFQNLTLHENEKVLKDTNKTLDNKNSQLTNILDNVEQGILSFKKDLVIHREYSSVCKKIFNECIGAQKLSSIIYPENDTMQEFIDDLLGKIFTIDKEQQGIYLTLLPEEILINNEILSLSYKVVKDENDEDIIMTIITDITEKKLLQKERDKEHDTLKMVVKTILNRDDFRELVFDFENFASKSFDRIPKEKYEETLREIHTFKGNFSQYEMVNLISKLDELESKLYEKNGLFYIKDIDNKQLKAWLMEDLGIIEAYAGENFIKDEEFCYVKKEQLLEIEKKVKETLSTKECRVILPLIKSLRYKSLKDLLRTYTDYIIKLSERLGKNVAPLVIEGDDVLVDSNYYQDVLKSMVHIFRNCVDHGLECEDTRLEMGKDLLGNIRCNITDLGDSFLIEISDDGKGIDLKEIKERVLKIGLYNDEEFNKLKQSQKLELIYEHGITTKKNATYVSGRGVGMAAVKQCIENINGKIKVESTENEGTRFIITLPKVYDKENVTVTAEDFMKEVMKKSKEIILGQTGIEFDLSEIETKNMVTLDKITALISLKGNFNSIMMVSVNECMAKEFVKGFIFDRIEEDDIVEYIDDVIGEISNTILGSSFGKFNNTNSKFSIGLPAVLSNSDGYVKYAQSEILSFKLNYKKYQFNIHMLLINDEVTGNNEVEDL
ncbi:hypothetical protein SH2C18_17160 [Clostridium sediminicola]|uniref:ATP-binding protein n=1 Tax=Clostridium sediminicola TaxID=3114879 RepID=UPI0031F237FA